MDLERISVHVEKDTWKEFAKIAKKTRQSGKSAAWHLREAMRLYLKFKFFEDQDRTGQK